MTQQYHDEDTCDRAEAMRCMHSDESLRMFLSRNPQRYTIKELATLTDFHRNTTKKAIKRIPEIQSIGSGNYTSYFMQSNTDHYRNIGEALKMIAESEGATDVEINTKMRSFGYALVKTNLEKIITAEYARQYNHNDIGESLIHLKMSYPFDDLIEIQKNGEKVIHSSVHLDFRKEDDKKILLISDCLCQGKEKLAYLCEMAAGALQAGIHFACQQFSTKINHVFCNENGSCEFEILTEIKASEEEEIALDDFL